MTLTVEYCWTLPKPATYTYNDYSVRVLRHRWKSLHKAVYAGAILTLTHWILTAFAFDPTTACAYLAVMLALRAVGSSGSRSKNS